MKKIIIIMLFFFIVKTVPAQVFNDSLYQHLYNFQIIKGELEKGDLCPGELKKSFNIQELIPKTNTSVFKVYKFYNIKYEEVKVDFLVVENSNYELYDIMSFSFLIDKIIGKDVDCSVKKLWIKEILRILNLYKDVNLDNSIVEKNYGGFTYFIPLKNYRTDSEIR